MQPRCQTQERLQFVCKRLIFGRLGAADSRVGGVSGVWGVSIYCIDVSFVALQRVDLGRPAKPKSKTPRAKTGRVAPKITGGENPHPLKSTKGAAPAESNSFQSAMPGPPGKSEVKDPTCESGTCGTQFISIADNRAPIVLH
jgi:hypothetical protein